MPVDAYGVITRLLSIGKDGMGMTKTIKEDELLTLCGAAKEIFSGQSSCVELDPPVNICGDIHGQYADLVRLFYKAGFPPTANYLFLGDYVDRGKQNLEVITMMFAFKVLYPKNFFLLRGNHELSNINRVYGFYEECNRRYGSTKLYEAFQDAFNWMPFTAVVGERILCMHGGLSPQLKALKQLHEIKRGTPEIGSQSLEMDLVWSDPVIDLNGFQINNRGASWGFGADVVQEKCKQLGLDLIARAHQVVQDGYEFFANRKLVTLFSAPYYCGQFDNAAALMSVDKNLLCTFIIFRPTIGRAVKKTVPTAQ